MPPPAAPGSWSPSAPSWGCAIAAFCLVGRTLLLRLFFGSITDDVMEAALIYFTITALSFPFLALYNAGAAIFRSTGNSAVSMKVSVIVNIINFCGNALCVYVLKMGVAGVAVPTLVSRAVGAVIILSLASRHDYLLRLTARSVTHLEGGTVRSILAIGIPSGLREQPVPAGPRAGGQHDLAVRHRTYLGQRRGQQPGQRGLHYRQRHVPGA